MIAILPLILLLVRRSHFKKLTLDDLPLLSETELNTMKKASKTAILIFIAFTVMSITLPLIMFPGNQQAAFNISLAITVVGLVGAGVFDLKAERIKNRGRPAMLQKEDQVRWYHILVSILLPYIGLPWGIVNLCRKKKKSGATMLIISCILLLFILIPIILASR
jgi:hypothetical protein